MSHQVRKLEEELGAELFERLPRALRLTYPIAHGQRAEVRAFREFLLAEVERSRRGRAR